MLLWTRLFEGNSGDISAPEREEVGKPLSVTAPITDPEGYDLSITIFVEEVEDGPYKIARANRLLRTIASMMTGDATLSDTRGDNSSSAHEAKIDLSPFLDDIKERTIRDFVDIESGFDTQEGVKSVEEYQKHPINSVWDSVNEKLATAFHDSKSGDNSPRQNIAKYTDVTFNEEELKLIAQYTKRACDIVSKIESQRRQRIISRISKYISISALDQTNPELFNNVEQMLSGVLPEEEKVVTAEDTEKVADAIREEMVPDPEEAQARPSEETTDLLNNAILFVKGEAGRDLYDDAYNKAAMSENHVTRYIANHIRQLVRLGEVILVKTNHIDDPVQLTDEVNNGLLDDLNSKISNNIDRPETLNPVYDEFFSDAHSVLLDMANPRAIKIDTITTEQTKNSPKLFEQVGPAVKTIINEYQNMVIMSQRRPGYQPMKLD